MDSTKDFTSETVCKLARSGESALGKITSQRYGIDLADYKSVLSIPRFSQQAAALFTPLAELAVALDRQAEGTTEGCYAHKAVLLL